MSRVRTAARWFLRFGVSFGIVAYILVGLDRGDLVRAVRGVRLDLLAAGAVVFLAGQVLSALKWRMIARSVGFGGRIGDYVRFYFVGIAFNLFGPSTIGGDVVRALYLGEGRRPGLAINSVLFDRLSGLVVLVAIGAGALLAFPQYAFPWPLTAATVAVGMALVVGWWACPLLVRLLPSRNRVRRQVEDELGPFWRDGGMLVRIAVVSAVFHLSQMGVQWILARAVGVALPFSYCMIMHPLLSVMTAVPISLNGLGVREGGYVHFLWRFGVSDSVAVTMSLLWWGMTLVSGLVGGLVFVASGAELPRLRSVREPSVDRAPG